MHSKITVHHDGGSYPIYVGENLLDRIKPLLASCLSPDSRHVLVTDQNVSQLYLQRVQKSLAHLHVEVVECPAGEQSKSLAQYRQTLQAILAAGLDRQSTVIALGGGVPGDLAGFVSATYMRGISLVQIPTTLLAQVDSSVGGKTGINLPGSKNSVGAFWQPKAVVVDPQTLRSLPATEFTSGLAEVVKYGVIMDEQFFSLLEHNIESINDQSMDILADVIRRSCELKAEVVRQDERETTGRRAILNYGHTFGHAIESVFGYGHFPHGHAVAMGMNAAAQLGLIQQRVTYSFVKRQNDLLRCLNIPLRFPGDRHQQLFETMLADKKAVAGNIRFVLPNRIGDVELVDSIPQAEVLEAMRLASL